MNSDIEKILIVGLGEIGYANAEYMTSIGIKPDGHDINPLAVNRAFSNEVIQNSGIVGKFSGYGVYVICVATHSTSNMEVIDTDPLYSVIRKIAAESEKGCLVCIESTMPIGLANQIGLMLTPERRLVVAPHRYYKYEADVHGVNQKRVIGAMNPESMAAGMAFYSGRLNIPMRRASSMDLAMFSKLVENSDRHLKITWAQQVKLACQVLGFSYDELRTIVNDKWNVGMLQALDGIGGHCLPKDSQMFVDALKQAGFQYADLIELSKIQNEQYKILTRRSQIPIRHGISQNE